MLFRGGSPIAFGMLLMSEGDERVKQQDISGRGRRYLSIRRMGVLLSVKYALFICFRGIKGLFSLGRDSKMCDK